MCKKDKSFMAKVSSFELNILTHLFGDGAADGRGDRFLILWSFKMSICASAYTRSFFWHLTWPIKTLTLHAPLLMKFITALPCESSTSRVCVTSSVGGEHGRIVWQINNFLSGSRSSRHRRRSGCVRSSLDARLLSVSVTEVLAESHVT